MTRSLLIPTIRLLRVWPLRDVTCDLGVTLDLNYKTRHNNGEMEWSNGQLIGCVPRYLLYAVVYPHVLQWRGDFWKLYVNANATGPAETLLKAGKYNWLTG